MKLSALSLAFALCVTAFAARPAHAQPAHLSRAEIASRANDLLVRNYPADGPGAVVLIAQGDTVLFRAARGEADVASHTSLRPDSVFRIGSVTKQFTAAGVLTLVEEGRISLDDPLSKYLPDFPNGDAISILELLNHTSGVRNFNGLPNYTDTIIRSDMTTAELIAIFANEPPDFAPGENWAYSNSGYVLLGAVIEAVTGEPWHAYLERVLFRPLHMDHTGYGADPRFARQQVQGYSFDGESVVPLRPMSMTQPNAAGALLSTADDLLRWNRALHEGRVLRRAEYRRMITPVGQAANAGIGYGLGLYTDTVRERPVLWHGGRIFGFIASLSYIPGPDISVIILENDDAENAPEPARTLARRFAAIALGDPYPDAVAVAVDGAALQAAEGVYSFEGGVTRTLRVVDGHLTAQRNDGPRATLIPIAADDFLYDGSFSRLKIERGAGGEIVAVRFFANGDGAGVIGARTGQAPAEPQAVQLPRAALERLVAQYASNEVALRVFMDGDALKAQLEGQEPVTLRARSETEFAVVETDATLEFSASAEELTIRQGGRRVTLQRAR